MTKNVSLELKNNNLKLIILFLGAYSVILTLVFVISVVIMFDVSAELDQTQNELSGATSKLESLELKSK
jgi:hypothetical protein